MSSIGRLISRHRNSAALSLITICFGLMLIACGGLLLAVRGKVDPDGIALINNTIMGCLVIGLLLTAGGFYIRRGVWLLGDEGVEGPPAQGSRTWRYRDVAETCQFYRHGISVGLAWRKAADQDWIAVSAQLGGYRKFKDTFMHGFLQARVPFVLDQLERGHVVDFKIVNHVGQLQKNFALGIQSYVNVSTDSIKLSRYQLSFPGRDLRIADIANIDTSAWTSRIGFVLRDGSKAGLSYTALFDAPLLLALLESLTSKPD